MSTFNSLPDSTALIVIVSVLRSTAFNSLPDSTGKDMLYLWQDVPCQAFNSLPDSTLFSSGQLEKARVVLSIPCRILLNENFNVLLSDSRYFQFLAGFYV